MTPFVQVMKQSGSTFGYDGSTLANNVLLRKEAQLQGISSVKVWACKLGLLRPEVRHPGRVGRQRHLRRAVQPAVPD